MYKYLIHFIYLWFLLAMIYPQNCVNSRTLANTTKLESTNEAVTINSIGKQENITTVESPDNYRSNNTKVGIYPSQTASLQISQPTSGKVLTHILREKRQRPDWSSDLFITHLQCDLDQNGIDRILNLIPKHCLRVYNTRFESEQRYRVFKTYQLEGFFFAQYYERLKRFETDPHTWDYSEL